MQHRQDAGNTTSLAILREADHLLGQQDDAAAEAICRDVYECPSESAVPLSREAFACPHDTRWGITSPGQYGRSRSRPGNHVLSL